MTTTVTTSSVNLNEIRDTVAVLNVKQIKHQIIITNATIL